MATAVTTFFTLIGIIFISTVLIFIPILFGMGVEQDKEDKEDNTLIFIAIFICIEWLGLIILLSVLIL